MSKVGSVEERPKLVPSAEGALPVAENQTGEEETSDIERLCAELEDAFRSAMKIPPDAESAVVSAVVRLAYLSTYKPLPSWPRFRRVGYKEARKQLDDLARSAEMMKLCLDGLSATAINALADHEVREAAKRWIAKTSSDLSPLAIIARDANVSDVRERGREKDRRVIGAARIVIDAYEQINGCDADKPASIFSQEPKPRVLEPLVKKIFDVLDIEANAKAAIEAALLEQQQNAATLKERGKVANEATIEQRKQQEQLTSCQSEEFFNRMQRTQGAERSPRFWKKNSPPDSD
jgi:hypothetical protein